MPFVFCFSPETAVPEAVGRVREIYKWKVVKEDLPLSWLVSSSAKVRIKIQLILEGEKKVESKCGANLYNSKNHGTTPLHWMILHYFQRAFPNISSTSHLVLTEVCEMELPVFCCDSGNKIPCPKVNNQRLIDPN